MSHASLVRTAPGVTYRRPPRRLAAASVICITPEIIVGIFIQRYIIKGLSTGSIKG